MTTAHLLLTGFGIFLAGQLVGFLLTRASFKRKQRDAEWNARMEDTFQGSYKSTYRAVTGTEPENVPTREEARKGLYKPRTYDPRNH